MSLSARKARQDLSADSLFRLIRAGCKAIPDPHTNPGISLGDALVSAFAMFSR